MLETDERQSGTGKFVSPYLLNEPRILRDACRARRFDKNRRPCPHCDLREFCEAQARRAGRFIDDEAMDVVG